MTDDLKLPQVGELTLPRWQYWLARYNEVLSEKSGRIEKLEAALHEVAKINNKRDRFSADIDAIIVNALGEEP
jgi:hypothetical protein